MRKPYFWIWIVCVVMRVVPLQAADEQPGGMLDQTTVIQAAKTVTSKQYPNADSVLVDEFIRVKYEADGTSETWDDEYVKVLTEKGKRDYQSLSYHFTLPYGTVEVVRLELIRPDGTVIPVDVATQSRVMVDRSQMSQNIFNPNSKILQVGVPGIEIGDICHLVTHRTTVKPRVPDTWSDYTVLEYTTPIRHLTYEVSAPKARPLVSILMKDEVPDTVTFNKTERADRILYRWEARNVPRAFSEPNMPPMYRVVQRLLVSTIPDWEYISRWYWQLSLPHLEASNKGITDKVGELISGANSRADKIDALFQFVSQDIRYMGLTTETEAPGYEPHDVCITFDNRYGVCRDKAALLVTMLREAGVPAYPVLIHAGIKKDEEVAQPYFNHAIVAAESKDGDFILMDPTDENTTELLPAYLSNKSFLVAHPEGRSLQTSPIVPASENMLQIRTTGTLTAEGMLRASTTLAFRGINDNAYRGYFSRIKPEERKRFFEGALKRRMAGATLSGYRIEPLNIQDTSQPLTVMLEYSAERYPVEGDSHTMVNIPWLGTAMGYANFVLGQTGLEQRKYPLFTKIACGVDEALSIDFDVADDYTFTSPEFATIEHDSLAFSASATMSNTTLHAATRFVLPVVEYSPEAYRVLKQDLKDIEYERRKMLLVQHAAGRDSESDMEILSSVSRIELKDHHNWTERQTITKRVLTYAGKKENSELQISYNPAWEDLKLVSAVVTSPDGSRHEVVESEINIMDARWVGSAPRYPAGRTMVVSLPAVQEGGLIEYTLMRFVRDRPFFSVSKVFAAMDPVRTNRLEIVAPWDLALQIEDQTGEAVTYMKRTEGTHVTYCWEAVDQKVLPEEDAIPPLWSFCPTLWVSGGSWSNYAADVMDVLDQRAASSIVAEKKARDLCAQAEGMAAGVAIRDFVARNVRSAGPVFAALPLEHLSSADMTLKEGYGHNADRAILLHAMLKAVGLSPEFVLVSSTASKKMALRKQQLACPQYGMMDTVMVCVKDGTNTVYLGDTDQYAQPGCTPRADCALMGRDGAIDTLSVASAHREQTEQVVEMTVDTDGTCRLTVTRQYYGSGFGFFHRKFAELPPEERRRTYLEMLGSLSQSAVAETDLVTRYDTYPGIQTFTARIERFAVRSGNYLYLTLPGKVPALASLRADKRENPLYRSEPEHYSSTYNITLPDAAVEVLLLPGDVRWEAPAGLGTVSLASRYTPALNGKPAEVRITRELALNPAVIPSADYPALLEMNRRLQHPELRTLLIRMK